MIHNALHNQPLPVYITKKRLDPRKRSCEGILAASNNGTIGEVYNIGGECELQNIDIVKRIINQTGASESLITYVTDRPGHDFRYAINNSKIKQTCGWKPSISFEDGLIQTIEWYKNNTKWLNEIISGEYQHYYKEQYNEGNHISRWERNPIGPLNKSNQQASIARPFKTNDILSNTQINTGQYNRNINCDWN